MYYCLNIVYHYCFHNVELADHYANVYSAACIVPLGCLSKTATGSGISESICMWMDSHITKHIEQDIGVSLIPSPRSAAIFNEAERWSVIFS